MAIELPPDYLKNLLIVDNLLQSCSIETIIKYFHLAGPIVTDQIQCNVRFCTLLKKYLCSMEQRKNVRILFSQQKRFDNNNMNSENKIAREILDCNQDYKFHSQEEFEMYATMQMSNVKQKLFAASFDILFHISIPCSAYNLNMDRRKISFVPNSTFLIESIDFEISISKIAKKNILFTVHEKPAISWSQYGRPMDDRECIYTNVTSTLQGFSATNALLNRPTIICENNFPLKQYCKEWQGNYLIAIVLFCQREFKN